MKVQNDKAITKTNHGKIQFVFYKTTKTGKSRKNVLGKNIRLADKVFVFWKTFGFFRKPLPVPSSLYQHSGGEKAKT